MGVVGHNRKEMETDTHKSETEREREKATERRLTCGG